MGLASNIVHLFAPLTAYCRSFREHWEAAGGLGLEGVSGRWKGEWISAATGHRGRLWCVLIPVAPTRWRMYFRAEYSRVFRACYASEFDVTQEDGRWTFSGGSDLGILAGGRYEHSGYATREEMVCRYRSAYDHGEFRLRRISG